MPISYPITLPTGPSTRNIVIQPLDATTMTGSPFTFQAQVQVNPGQMWTLEAHLPPLVTRARAGKWVGALTSLCGHKGSFLMGDSANLTPRGVGTGTPLVKGAGQTGNLLVTDGWTVSQTNIMRTGDWFQLGSGATARLYMLVSDSDSNGSGEATLEFWPNLRTTPADNAALVVSSPMGKFMLAQGIRWSIDEARIFGLSFNAIEDLRP